jgi:hypothetical protein
MNQTKQLPENCIAKINGNLVLKNQYGRFDIYATGIGYWAFNLSEQSALQSAESLPVTGYEGQRECPVRNAEQAAA